MPAWINDTSVPGSTGAEILERILAFSGVRERFCATQPACRILTAGTPPSPFPHFPTSPPTQRPTPPGHWLNHLGETLAKKYRELIPRRKMIIYSSVWQRSLPRCGR